MTPGNSTTSAQPVVHGEGLLYTPPIETHLLRSELIRQTFKIQVMQPARRGGENRRYPVVYVTDANWVFDMFKSISYLMQMRSEDAPPYILVGIGYPSDSPFAGMLLRAREYTYPPYPKFDINAGYRSSEKWRALSLYDGALLPEEGAKSFFGALDFHTFLGEQLIPFIDRTYPTTQENRTYFGHSGGGFFGLFSIFACSPLFRNYIVSSPGLLYHGVGPGEVRYENYDCGAQLVRDFHRSGKTLDGVKLYVSIGAEEEFERAIDPWKIVSGFYQFERVIRDASIPGLHFMSEVFAGESHKSVWPIAFIHGMQAVFGIRRVARAIY